MIWSAESSIPARIARGNKVGEVNSRRVNRNDRSVWPMCETLLLNLSELDQLPNLVGSSAMPAKNNLIEQYVWLECSPGKCN